MTMRELLAFFEGFYGEKYSGIFLDTMTAYLADCSPSFYKATATVIVKRFSRTFGKAPGPAEIELNMNEILQAIPKPVLLPECEPELTESEREDARKMLKNFFDILENKSRGRTA